MTNLSRLPLCTSDQITATNADWTGALTFWWDQAQTVPISLNGIVFTMTVRAEAGDPNVVFQGSTADGTLTLLSAGVTAAVNGGTGYALGDTFTLQGGTGAPAVFAVSAIAGSVPTVVSLSRMGSYTVLPNNPVATTTLTGAGSGLTLNLTWVNNAVAVTVPRASFPPLLKAGSYVYEIRGDDGTYSDVVASGALIVTPGIVLP